MKSVLRIATMDPDEATRNLLKEKLTELNWTVLEANNGKRALESLQSNTPDLILLDLLMPEMDGFEFMDAIRANDKHVLGPEWPLVWEEK